ncbi:MAG: two-component sensor histidine kinase [Treponema sp.]|nr:two-component sensor histidine kinase [Treponema sp.]
MRGFVKRVTKKISKLSSPQIEEVLQAITDENDMFDSVFESLTSGLIIVDGKWQVISNNKMSERLLPFKIRPDDSRADDEPLWNLIDDPDIAAFFKSSYENDRFNVCSEFSIATSGGSTRFITVTLTPFVQNHRSAGTVVTIADITEKRSQEVLLHRMESLASLTTLAANVAHEIKNPLGAISIHIQLIQKVLRKAREGEGTLPDKKFLEHYLDVVTEEIENLNKIVVDFLFAVRPVQANLELISPDALLKRFVEFFKPQFDENNVQVTLSLCNDCPRLLLDEKLFREVTVNIAQNALAAILERRTAQTGDFGARFTITSKLAGDKCIFTFSDTGIGMSETTVSHIFEPYYTTKANGTGLGMTMVYKIIKELRGDISVTSERGKGTVFTIELPVPQTETKLLASHADMQPPMATEHLVENV